MKIYRTIPTLVGAASLLALTLPGVAGAVDIIPGYLAGGGEDYVVRSGNGNCIRTGSWTREKATQECDPDIWAEMNPPVEVAAVEPRTVTVQKTYDAEALFGFDKDQLTDEAKGTLQGLINEIEDTNVIGVQVIGHTDRIGSDDWNQPLSERRAAAVATYLQEQTDTVPDAEITMKGVGSAEPVVACEGLRGDPLVECLKPNRRVVVEVTTEREEKQTN